MELIETQLSEFTNRSRSLAIDHTATGLRRGLEYGERVLVRSNNIYRTAVVADIAFTADDTHYRLVLGGVVPTQVAEDRLLGEINMAPPRRTSQVTVEDVATLLSSSAAGKSIPMQRQVAHRLQRR